jgi:hypothetical protein
MAAMRPSKRGLQKLHSEKNANVLREFERVNMELALLDSEPSAEYVWFKRELREEVVARSSGAHLLVDDLEYWIERIARERQDSLNELYFCLRTMWRLHNEILDCMNNPI